MKASPFSSREGFTIGDDPKTKCRCCVRLISRSAAHQARCQAVVGNTTGLRSPEAIRTEREGDDPTACYPDRMCQSAAARHKGLRGICQEIRRLRATSSSNTPRLKPQGHQAAPDAAATTRKPEERSTRCRALQASSQTPKLVLGRPGMRSRCCLSDMGWGSAIEQLTT